MGGVSTPTPPALPLPQLSGAINGNGVPIVASDSVIVPPSPFKPSPPASSIDPSLQAMFPTGVPNGVLNGGSSNIALTPATGFLNGNPNIALPPLGSFPTRGSGQPPSTTQALLHHISTRRRVPTPTCPVPDRTHRTGAGIKKATPKTNLVAQKVIDAVAGSAQVGAEVDKVPFRFLDLPGGMLFPCQ